MPQQTQHTQCNILINEAFSLTGSSIKQQESPIKSFFSSGKYKNTLQLFYNYFFFCYLLHTQSTKHILQLFYIYFFKCYPLKYFFFILSNQDNFQKGFDVSTSFTILPIGGTQAFRPIGLDSIQLERGKGKMQASLKISALQL